MSLPLLYVLDTHAIVWFLKRNKCIGAQALRIMLNSQSRLVVPAYIIDEIRLKSLTDNPQFRRDRIGLPPATVLRLIMTSHNIKDFPRSPAVLVEELRLQRAVQLRRQTLDKQDIPICATALAIQKALSGSMSVILITKDAGIRRWAQIPIVWN